jgi:hypothetical protein
VLRFLFSVDGSCSQALGLSSSTYLRDSIFGLSLSASCGSASVFHDLLASMERKYSGTECSDGAELDSCDETGDEYENNGINNER